MQNCVFVLDQNGQALMPCSPRKARLLLKAKEAKPVSKTPFTIQLLKPVSSYKQELVVGIDTGQKHIGIAVVRDNTVIYQAQVTLRQDVKGLIDTRRSYRKDRRNRNTRYRKPRYNNRVGKYRKTDYWHPPSVQSKVNHNIKWIERMRSVVPEAKVIIELGKFDPQKLKDPTIEGVGYQQGELYGWENRRMYVFSRDNYTCQVCKRKRDVDGKRLKLQAHHIIYRSLGGSDRVDNLLTVCTYCHTYKNHQPGGELYGLKEKAYKKPKLNLAEATKMNIIKSSIVRKYQDDEKVNFTWGYVTNLHRRGLGLSKSHTNDAVAITGIREIEKQPKSYILFYQYRKKKRSLHEATPRKGRKEPNRHQKRYVKNTPYADSRTEDKRFYLGDKVSRASQTGYISGFSGIMAYVADEKCKPMEFINSKGVSRRQTNLSELEVRYHTNGWRSFCVPAE